MKEKLNLKNPITGKQILEAVQRIAKENFFKTPSPDDPKMWIVGRKSHLPNDIAIGVGPHALAQINLNETYTEVYVCAWDYGEGKYKIEYSSDEAQSAVTEFAQMLQKII